MNSGITNNLNLLALLYNTINNPASSNAMGFSELFRPNLQSTSNVIIPPISSVLNPQLNPLLGLSYLATQLQAEKGKRAVENSFKLWQEPKQSLIVKPIILEHPKKETLATEPKPMQAEAATPETTESPQVNYASTSQFVINTPLGELIHFVMQRVDKAKEEEITRERLKYKDDKNLTTIFDILVDMYSSRVKTKEEMVKYTLRRAFKYTCDNILKTPNPNSKQALSTLCKRYFKNPKGDPDLLLPFRYSSIFQFFIHYFSS
jgi:hypothetical protein